MELDRRDRIVQPSSRANRLREERVDEVKPFASASGRTSGAVFVSRVPPVQTAVRNCMGDEGRAFGVAL